MRVLLTVTLALLLTTAAARAQSAPEAVVDAHFAAIAAEDFTGADRYFSEAFIGAFKADVAKLNDYYIARYSQVARGYSFLETATLVDEDREAAVVVVEFNDPAADAVVQVAERMYYYLVREKVPAGSFGRDNEGRAWRIDIFDALRYDSLADARRRPYLYTREAWPEEEGQELKSRQGLFRLQWALTSYFEEQGQYPGELLGGDLERDPLIKGQYVKGAYPPSGFSDRPVAAVDFPERSAGDFTYYPVDDDGDGVHEDYWLLLHGRVPENYYFKGYDTIYILSSHDIVEQAEQAQLFADYWAALYGDQLEMTHAVFPNRPATASISPTGGLIDYDPGDGDSVQVATAPPQEKRVAISPILVNWAASHARLLSLGLAGTVNRHLPRMAVLRPPPKEPVGPPAPEVITVETAAAALPAAVVPLKVYSYGM